MKNPEKIPDPAEVGENTIPPIVNDAIAMLAQRSSALAAPMPQGLSDFDALAVVQRRAQLQASLANAEGVVRAALWTARAYRKITAEQYQQQMQALADATDRGNS